MTVFSCVKRYFKKHIGILLITILTIAVITLITLVPPQILKIICDKYLAEKKSSGLIFMAAMYVLSYVIIGVANFTSKLLLIKISQGVSKETRSAMLKKMHNITYRQFSALKVGDIEAYFNNDVTAIDALITSGAVNIVIDAFKVIGIIISIFFVGIYFGVIVLALLPIIILIALGIRKGMFQSQTISRKVEAEVNSGVYETINKTAVIKSYGAEEFIGEKNATVVKKHYDALKKSSFFDSVFAPTMQIIKYLIIVSVILLGSGKPLIFGVTTGALLAVIDLIGNIFTPIENLGAELLTVQKSLSGVARVNNFFAMEENQNSVKTKEDNGIELNNVTFSYGGQNVIENLSLRIEKGERLTILGESGAGKSTLVKLITGLLVAEKGEIFVFGKNPASFTENERKKYFSCLFQDAFFSGGTIKQELSLFAEINDEKIFSAIKAVGLEKRITDINAPLVSADFSSGEQALLNLARALTADAEIIFLDELNAKLDKVTLNKIIETLNKLSGKTIISISHFGKNLNNTKILTL